MLSLIVLFALACGDDSEQPASPAAPTPLGRDEGEAVLTTTALSDADLPAGWTLQDELALHPTPFGYQPTIVNLLRELDYDAAHFVRFTQRSATGAILFVEESLLLYDSDAAAREGYEVATAESAVPLFFGGWPRAYHELDPSAVTPNPQPTEVGQRSLSFSSSCPTPGRAEELQDCTGILARDGALLMVLVMSDAAPVDLTEITQQVSERVAQELALALADASTAARQSARMILDPNDVEAYEFSDGVRAHEHGFTYEDVDKTTEAQEMGVLGGSSVTFSDPHSLSRLTATVTIYDSEASAEEGFDFEDAEAQPPDVDGTSLEAGDEGLAYYGATAPRSGSSLTDNEDFVIVRLAEVVATIRVRTPEESEPPIPTSAIVDSLLDRISAEVDS